MRPLRIWAPTATRVEVIGPGGRVDAEREPEGWWRGPMLAPGDGYMISLDGGPPHPDPRSRWQPEGVHGESRWIEPVQPPPLARHVPLRDGLLYELHVGTFTADGTFGS